MTTQNETAANTAAELSRGLSFDELSTVVARVRSTDHEHGLTACFAVAEVLGLSPVPSEEPRELVADRGFTRLRDINLPAAQWAQIARAIHDAAERVVAGGSEEVLHDWATFGPRVIDVHARF